MIGFRLEFRSVDFRIWVYNLHSNKQGAERGRVAGTFTLDAVEPVATGLFIRVRKNRKKRKKRK